MNGAAIQLIVHPRLIASAASFCRELTSALTSRPPSFSIAISRTPDVPGPLQALAPPPVMPVYIDAEGDLVFGPLWTPGRAVCPACFDHWLRMQARGHGDRNDNVGAGAAEMVARLLHDWSERFTRVGQLDDLERHATALCLRDRHVVRHPVFPLRDCSDCAPLRSTFDDPRVHCSPKTGIVSRLELTDAPSAGAYRATATWNPPLPVPSARPLLMPLHSFGRGRTARDAESGCIGEALERYSLIYRGDEPMVRAKFPDIDAVLPNEIQCFSDAQFRGRCEWNAVADEDFWVPEPFQEEVEIDWLEARALGSAPRSRWVAAACCLMWYQFRPGEPEFARADTIGCGAGQTFDDALAHALLEWVERDAMAIWWDNRLPRPGLDLDSLECAELEMVVEGLRATGRDLFLLDCTTDVAIPAVVAVAPRFDGTEPLFAGAADLSVRTAAYKAASEVGQVWYEARRSGSLSESLRSWLLNETTAMHRHLLPHGSRDAGPMATPSSAARRCAVIIERLEAVGLRAYAVDHTRSDVALQTVRAVVPGLRHIWKRRAPGRLYDVPVRMGWLGRPRAEDELNRIPCMI